MPIRWRLTRWFALILCAILGLSGVTHYILLQRNLQNQMDDTLRALSAQVQGTLNPQEIGEPLNYDVIHLNLPPINDFASPGTYIQLIDRNGVVAAKSDTLGDQELPVNPSLIETGFAGSVAFQTVAAGDGVNLRIMVSPLYMRDQTLLLEVAQSSVYIESTMSQVRWVLIASVLIALALTTVLGGVIVRSALSPVRQITETARRIETSPDLSRRVGYRGPMDEIGQLAATFDHMIERLDKAFQSQKHFVADASHELRSPLTVIKGNLDLLRRNISKADRQESLRALEAETARMIKIVNDLLLLAEVDSSQLEKKEAVTLKGILEGELERARSLAGNRKLVIQRQEDLVVRGDVQRLKQLLGNLIDNAMKYTPGDGTVTLALFRDGNWACVEVSDTGTGIAPQHLPHIFDRFYRVDKARSQNRGGAGLGLTIAKEIAEQHGGTITVTSQPGKGSTFTVRLKP
ncbi:MAG: HAMP domain-containing protein [Desulfobacteraceae bacterium]|nr:HAMP domain-containing protein [Desulfobacteraceae bacterium]